jgi:glutamyl/glutaminyl-tRNA synthetase
MRIDFNDRPKEYDQIILPKKLQLIFDFFVELDNAIDACKRRGKIPILPNLKQYIEMATHRNFDINHFRKVYYVAPELYYYNWQTVPGGTTQEIRIEIPENIEEIITKVHKKSVTVEVKNSPIIDPMTNFLSNKRKIIMRTRLILYIENLHKNFLNQQGCRNADYNAVKGWHPNFDIENIMDLQKKTIKNMPRTKKGETISEFLKKKNIKNTLLKRTSEVYSSGLKADINQASQSTGHSSFAYPSPEKRSPAKINSGIISPSFYKRIEAKERIYKEEKKKLENESKRGEGKRKTELMLKIAQAVKSVFSVKGKVNTLFLNHVLKYLNGADAGNYYSKKDLINTLKEIACDVPEWLTLKKHDRGFLVKI